MYDNFHGEIFTPDAHDQTVMESGWMQIFNYSTLKLHLVIVIFFFVVLIWCRVCDVLAKVALWSGVFNNLISSLIIDVLEIQQLSSVL